MKRFLSFFCVQASLLLAVCAAPASISLVPFTFAGRIVDYAHIGYDAESAVEVRVRNAAGELLAKTKTRTSGITSYNYVLPLPVANQPTAGFATVGERVTFEFIDPYGTVYAGLVAAADAVVGNPGAVKRLDVILATDSDHDGVADEYLDSIEYWMWKSGIEGPYDAQADYDNDGHSNYEEYLAGTNPCDATDTFSIRQMTFEAGIENFVKLRVPVTQGRSYSVVDSPTLENPRWTQTTFTEDPAVAPQKTNLQTGPAEVGYRTIFVRREGPSHFYKVKVE